MTAIKTANMASKILIPVFSNNKNKNTSHDVIIMATQIDILF